MEDFRLRVGRSVPHQRDHSGTDQRAQLARFIIVLQLRASRSRHHAGSCHAGSCRVAVLRHSSRRLAAAAARSAPAALRVVVDEKKMVDTFEDVVMHPFPQKASLLPSRAKGITGIRHHCQGLPKPRGSKHEAAEGAQGHNDLVRTCLLEHCDGQQIVSAGGMLRSEGCRARLTGTGSNAIGGAIGDVLPCRGRTCWLLGHYCNRRRDWRLRLRLRVEAGGTHAKSLEHIESIRVDVVVEVQAHSA